MKPNGPGKKKTYVPGRLIAKFRMAGMKPKRKGGGGRRRRRYPRGPTSADRNYLLHLWQVPLPPQVRQFK